MSSSTFGGTTMASGNRINDGGFFSNVSDWAGRIGGIAGAIGGALNPQPPAQGSVPPVIREQPTYQGPGNTTGTPTNDKPMNYTPFIIGGVAILALVLILKK